MRQRWRWHDCVVIGVLGVSIVACGGEVVGIGNSANRIGGGDVLKDVAHALAEQPATPTITDEMLAQIFSAILGRAAQGDAEAALVVLKVALEQRQTDDG